jgi:hypothetical protein
MLTVLQSKYTRRAGVATATALALPLATGTRLAAAAPADDLRDGAVFAQTNKAAGNEIAVFSRAADGGLSFSGNVPTGGNGTGSGLGSQGAVLLSRNGRWLFAVNAGSNSISVMRVNPSGLELAQTIGSGGVHPISLTLHDDLLYVLNDGGSGNITGFKIGSKGQLAPLAGSTRGLGGAATGPAQVGFAPDGDTLVVTEKAANAVVTYRVDDSRPGQPRVHPSSGNTPFGFDFAGRDTLVVSEAGGGPSGTSAVSSYEVDDGDLEVRSASVPDHQKAACWIATTDNGRYAYAANAASDSISGFRVDGRGHLTLLNADGVTAYVGAGTHPTDMAMTQGSRFLYVLDAFLGKISGFRVAGDGGLSSIGAFGDMGTAAVGLASR